MGRGELDGARFGSGGIGRGSLGGEEPTHALPTHALPTHPLPAHPLSAALAGEDEGDGVVVKSDGQFEGLKLIPNPPDLECWRQRLFAVDEMVLLSEEQ